MENNNNTNYIRAYEYQKNVDPNMSEIKTTITNYDDYDFDNEINFVDFSEDYNTKYKLTSPNLLCGFIKFIYNFELESDTLDEFNSTSSIFYVIEGDVKIESSFNSTIYNNFHLKQGDILVLPHFNVIKISSTSDIPVSIFYINDSPLLNYLGVKPNENIHIFKPSHYTKDFLLMQLEELSDKNNNRKGILLANEDTENMGTKTITHTLWALYNELPPNMKQRVHKHNSIAIDFCLFSPDEKKVYTSFGDEVDENNNIINPEIYHWKTGSVFITPPGKWHSHHNETNTSAYVLPIQDAGLLLYQRILGIVLT